MLWLATLGVILNGRVATSQQPTPSVLGAEARVRYSENSRWRRGIGDAVADSGLALRQGTKLRFLRRDSIAYVERRMGKDRGTIAYIAIVASVLGFVVGDQLGRRNRNDVGGAVGSAYGGFLGAATGAVVGGAAGVVFVPEQWKRIDVGLVFKR